MALDATTFNNVSVMKDSKTDADTGIIVNTYLRPASGRLRSTEQTEPALISLLHVLVY